MASRMQPQAKRLLDAHVDYILGRLSGEPLQQLIATEVEQLFAEAEKVTLQDAVTRDMIKATAKGYAVDLELSGAIPELVGDIARTLYAHPIHATTTLNDLLPDGLFEEFLDKILDMHELHRWIVHEAVANPLYSTLASDLLLDGIRGYLHHSGERVRRIPGLRQASQLMGNTLLRNALPMLEENLEENLSKYVQKSLQGLLSRSEDFLLDLFDEEKVRAIAVEAWDIVKGWRIADLKEGVSSLDIEEFFVIGYEAWRALRTTPFYSALIDSGIDSFFDKYGDSTLREVLDEMGITPEIALRDANRFAPPVLAMLKRKKLLEPYIRRHLAGFYESSAVATILAETATPAAPPAAAKAEVKADAKTKAPAKAGSKPGKSASDSTTAGKKKTRD